MQKSFFFISILLLCLLGTLSGREVTANDDLSADGNPIVTLQADGLHLLWQTAAVQMTMTAVNSRVTIPHFLQTEEPGMVQLPMRSVLIALPPTAVPTLTIQRISERQIALPAPLAVAQQPEGFVRNGAGEIVGGAFAPADAKRPFTHPPLLLEEIGIVRGIRLARLSFYPVRPSDGQISLVEEIEADISFNAPAAHRSPAIEENPFGQTVAALLINPEQMQAQLPRRAASTATAAANTAIIDVDEAGITAISYSELKAIGFPVDSINPANLKLTQSGTEVALEWVGDGDTLFETGEFFRFYADIWFNRWLENDRYLLTEGSGGLRMGSRAALPSGLSTGALQQTVLLNKNLHYTSNWMAQDGDRWIWDEYASFGNETSAYPFAIENVNSAAGSSVTVWLMGAMHNKNIAPDHRIQVSLNGTSLGEVTWDGKDTGKTAVFSIPPTLLQSSNSLQITLLHAAGIELDRVWLDSFAVTYTRNGAVAAAQTRVSGQAVPHRYNLSLGAGMGTAVYDISSPGTPIRLTGVMDDAVVWGDAAAGVHEYLLTSDLIFSPPAGIRMAVPLQTVTTMGADYIIIAPPAFIPAVTPLIAMRQSQGMSVVVENVDAIYDNYGGGLPTPEAIRAYLDDVYHRWSPVPVYVLLVGDGSNDPKPYLDSSRPTFIPPYLADVDPWLGEVAADNRFVTVDGDDLLPDMAIGRLPVNSLAEVKVIINKIVQYETEPLFGDWNSRVLFTTDDPDGAGNFITHADALIAEFISTPWLAERAYYNPPSGMDRDEMYTAVVNQWNAGRGLVIYHGHSSVHQWGAERLFHLDDARELVNDGRLPVVLQMTCFTGSFHDQNWDTLDEELLRREGGGAAAVWGATGLGVATGHDQLAGGFLQTIITDGTPQIGKAAVAGKVRLLGAGVYPDLMDTFTLLGDPAMRYNYDFWAGNSTFLPVILR